MSVVWERVGRWIALIVAVAPWPGYSPFVPAVPIDTSASPERTMYQ